MGNLGWYQKLTTIAKFVGGPKRLVAYIFLGGGAAFLGADKGIGWLRKKRLSKRMKREADEAAMVVYTVTVEGRSNEGLLFNVGDEFRVLEVDGDAALIDKIGDDNSPYFVSAQFLGQISDYGR